MTTQTQGKGKKKNKEVNKISLDEFNSIDAPHGHSVVSIKMTGLDWAATMADYEQSTDTQQIVVPVAPRAQRGPNVDYESLPDAPPFRASLYNLPMSANEKDIAENFLQDTSVLRVDMSSKSSTTVEFESKQDLYDALCKDGVSFKGKTVNVCLFGQTPQNNYSDRGYAGRGGNSSYNDRYDRQSGGFGGSRMGDRFGERSGFGNRDAFGSGYQRPGSGGGGFNMGQQQRGYDRFQERGSFRDEPRGSQTFSGGESYAEEPENWRDRPAVRSPPQQPMSYNGSRQPYTHSRSEQPPYQPPSHHQQYQHPESYDRPRYNQPQNQPLNHSPLQYNDRPGLNSRPMNSALPSAEERPKLIVQKRKKPLNIDDLSNVSRNAAIFGEAKPSSKPYEKMQEVEEKLRSVQISEKKISSQAGSQVGSQAGSQPGSQPGSAPRSRQVSERS